FRGRYPPTVHGVSSTGADAAPGGRAGQDPQTEDSAIAGYSHPPAGSRVTTSKGPLLRNVDMRRAIEHLAQARNCVARGEAVLRWQQRNVVRLIEEGHDELALEGRRMLVTIQG